MRHSLHRCSPTTRSASQLARAHGWRGLLTAFVLVTPFLVTGCEVQSRVQGRYIAQQEACRDEAESAPEQKEQLAPVIAPPPEDINQRIVTKFSECMNKAGWHVAVPKPATPLPTNTAQNPPSIFPSPQNPPATLVAPVQPGTVAKPGLQPVQPLAPAPVQNVAPTNPNVARPPTQLPSNTPAATGSTPTTAPQIGPGSMPNPPPALNPATSPTGNAPTTQAGDTGEPATYQPGRPYQYAPQEDSNGSAGRNF